MSFQAVKDALHLREIAARVIGLERRVKEPLVRFDFANLIENGGFDYDGNWVKGAGWAISGGVASRTNSGSVSRITSPSFQTTVGRAYAVRLTLSSRSSGQLLSVSVSGTGQSELSTLVTPGTYAAPFSGVGDATVYAEGSADFVGSIDNVSLWEADPADDAPWLCLPYGYSVGRHGMIVRDNAPLHPSDYTEITRDGQTFIKPLVAPGHDTEFSIWAGVGA